MLDQCYKCNVIALQSSLTKCHICNKTSCILCDYTCDICASTICTDCFVYCQDKNGDEIILCAACETNKYDICEECDTIISKQTLPCDDCNKKICKNCKHCCNSCERYYCNDCLTLSGSPSCDGYCQSCLITKYS